MNLRTQEEFFDEIARELIWRRIELTELKNLIETAQPNSVRQRVAIKSATALLYAHWEGFVKRASEAYLNYVDRQRLKNGELSDAMFAVVIRAKLQAAALANKIQPHIELVDFVRTKTEVRSRIPQKGVIRTESNLSSTILAEMLSVLEIEPKSYESKFKFIDKSLVDKRNHIAHGEDSEVTIGEYSELHQQVLGLIEQFRTDVENSVTLKIFRRKVA